jgi:hypothetical protein
MSSLAPVPAETATCPSCSAPLVADQRYCLSCGKPVSPVRHAFLDVLDGERRSPHAGAAVAGALPYATYIEPAAGPAWLRRYTPLFGVAAVLLVAMLIGLLLGHWVSQGKSPANQVIKVEGLSAGVPAAPTATTASTASGSSTAGAPSSAKEEKQEEAEAKAEEKKPAAPPRPKSLSTSTLNKISSTTGKRHQEEINKLGPAPIAVP